MSTWSKVIKNIETLKKDFELFEANINNPLILFGAGQFGQSAFNFLQKQGHTVKFFIDNSPKKQGIKIKGVDVINFDILKDLSNKMVFITAKHAISQIKRLLDKDKIPNISFDAWFAIKNLEKYKYLRNCIFQDEKSKLCLDGILLTMLTGNEKYSSHVMDFNQYFCLPNFVNTGNEYFVDAGAFVGDTIEKFIWANNGGFRHIYAFEPGKKQFLSLNHRKKRLIKEWALDSESISLINAGLSNENGYATINIDENTHILSTSLNLETNKDINKTDNFIKVFSLDAFIDNSPVTFIKSDIEGMEVPMLKGAVETIKRNKPKLALSTYHEPDDLFEMVEILKNLVPEYKMALRHHSPMLMDTTLYCWIEE